MPENITHPQSDSVPKRKVSEPEALKSMYEFYMRNKDNLPASVREKRTMIISLLMEGFSAMEAFALAENSPKLELW